MTERSRYLWSRHVDAPVFVVADHRGQDPASSVLSFEGRCYLLIQIKIQTGVDIKVVISFLTKAFLRLMQIR